MSDRIYEHLSRHLLVAVRGGHQSYDAIRASVGQRVRDELGKPDAALEQRLRARTEELVVEHTAAERGWPSTPTTNDAIEIAFAELAHRHHIIALENAGYTTSDGWEDVAEERAHQPKARGATFYHGQDLERGIDDKGLLLAFGAFVEGAKHDAESIAIGEKVCEVLAAHGVATEWDRSVKKRIQLVAFPWRKRRERRR